jgi:dihydrofolate reductase
MRKLIVTEFVSLDGVIEDPGGSENWEHGGWSFRFDRGPEGDKFKLDEVLESDALLLGRKTYEGFAAAWPSRTDDVGFADKMNSMPKYVVSRTLDSVDWSGSELLKGDVVDEVAKLKEQPGRDILVYGSAQLVRTLVRAGLVDEVRLMVFPVWLGSGLKLFDEGEMVPLERLETKQAGQAVVLVLRPAQAANEQEAAA